MASESMPVHSPQPRKPCSQQPAFWYPDRDAASEEGRCTPPLSRESTSMGNSPSFGDCRSPGWQLHSPSPDRLMSSPEVPWVGQTKQTSKVFVGGIPQDMDQFSLQREFSKYATVRKAWLPRPREGQNQSVSGTHRGFGFVIFQDDDAVDLLLGNENSKFFVLSDGSQVEVKRAVWNNAMSPKMQTERNIEAGDAANGVSCLKTQPSINKHQASEWRGYSQQGPIGAQNVSNRVKNMPKRSMTTHFPPRASFSPVDGKHVPSSWVEQSGSNHCQSPWLIQASPQGSMLWTSMPKGEMNAHGTSTSLPAEHWGAYKVGCGGCTTTGDLPHFPINGNQLATWSPEALFQQAIDLHGEGLVAVLCQNMPDHYED